MQITLEETIENMQEFQKRFNNSDDRIERFWLVVAMHNEVESLQKSVDKWVKMYEPKDLKGMENETF